VRPSNGDNVRISISARLGGPELWGARIIRGGAESYELPPANPSMLMPSSPARNARVAFTPSISFRDEAAKPVLAAFAQASWIPTISFQVDGATVITQTFDATPFKDVDALVLDARSAFRGVRYTEAASGNTP